MKNLLKELTKAGLSAAAISLGYCVGVGIWNGGVNEVVMKKTRDITKKKEDKKVENK